MQVAWGLGLSGVVGGRGIVCKNGDYSVMINFFRFSSPNLVRNFVGQRFSQTLSGFYYYCLFNWINPFGMQNLSQTFSHSLVTLVMLQLC
jgi:hypothetical protein